MVGANNCHDGRSIAESPALLTATDGTFMLKLVWDKARVGVSSCFSQR